MKKVAYVLVITLTITGLMLVCPSAATSKATWEVEWEQLKEAARKEGEIVIAGSTTAVRMRRPLQQTFVDKYGVKIEWVVGRSSEQLRKIRAERNAGLYLEDLLIGSSFKVFSELKKYGYFDELKSALILPEVLDEKAWYTKRLPFLDKESNVFACLYFPGPPLVINTDLVKPEEINSYLDLLNHRWYKKIIMTDPSLEGSATDTVFVLGEYLMGWDFVDKLAKQEPLIIDNIRVAIEWTAKGKYPISLVTTGASQFIKAGAPINFHIPKEGTYAAVTGGTMARFKNRPHPSATKLFINFLLSKEGQMMMQESTGRQSTRIDIPVKGVLPMQMRQPGAKYIAADNEEFQMKRAEFMKVDAKRLFGGLLK